MTIGSLLAVASGGALGALARFGAGRAVALWGADAYWSTVLVNVAGSFGLGAAAVWLSGRPGAWPLFVMVGFFGAFTTFSTFALDATGLLRDRGLVMAGAYVAGSVGLATAGFVAGGALAGGRA